MNRMFCRILVAALRLLLASAAAHAEPTNTFPAPAGGEDVLKVQAATDLEAMEPLIHDFQALRPEISVIYEEFQSVNLFAAARKDCDDQRSSADIFLSSSTDQLVRLSNDGCAVASDADMPTSLPRWTRWRDEVFGFTFEPGVIVFNRDLVPPEDIRRTRAELIELLRAKQDRYSGRVGIYDIEQAGIGYLLALYDARGTTVYGRLMETFARSRVVTRCCTSDLLADLATGKITIGYNLLGSYAVAALRKGSPLVIVVPRDFTIVLSRAALVPRYASNKRAAFAFLAYLLSPRGQEQAARASFFFSFDGPLPPGVDGPPSLTASALLRPIEVGAELLFVQDRAKRAHFVADWRRALGLGEAP